jgi:hypothetical protein
VYKITPSATPPAPTYSVLNDSFTGVDELAYDGSAYLYGAGYTANPAYATTGYVAFQMSLSGNVASPWPVGIGGDPNGLILGSDGNLYGTTRNGIVYSVSPTASMPVATQLYAFTDGETPFSPLLQSGSVFYGSTSNGGIFTFDSSDDSFSQLESINGIDSGPLCLGTDDYLYATTDASDAGTAFSDFAGCAPGSSCERLNYGFGGGSSGGSNPEAGLIQSNSTSGLFNLLLYGTTFGGGQGIANIITVEGYPGYGTVYSLNTGSDGSGSDTDEQIVHFFGG